MIDLQNLERLKPYRKRMGISQSMLAHDIGTSRSLIAAAEQGRRELPIDCELKFIELLKKSPESGDLPVVYVSEFEIAAEEAANKDFRMELEGRLATTSLNKLKWINKLAKVKSTYQKIMETVRTIDGSLAIEPGQSKLIYVRNKLMKELRPVDLLAQKLLQHDIHMAMIDEKFLQCMLDKIDNNEKSLRVENDKLILQLDFNQILDANIESESPVPDSDIEELEKNAENDLRETKDEGGEQQMDE